VTLVKISRVWRWKGRKDGFHAEMKKGTSRATDECNGIFETGDTSMKKEWEEDGVGVE